MRSWSYVLAGIVAGFGFLFFTVWDAAIPDARTIAAVLFALVAPLILLPQLIQRRNCTKSD